MFGDMIINIWDRKEIKMFLKTVIRQGNKIIEQNNMIKQYEEENKMLKSEVNIRIIKENRYARAFNKIMKLVNASDEIEHWNNSETFKAQTRNNFKNEIRTIINKELADCESN
jgi:ribosomal protein S20